LAAHKKNAYGSETKEFKTNPPSLLDKDLLMEGGGEGEEAGNPWSA
jgi:hypothetical protein